MVLNFFHHDLTHHLWLRKTNSEEVTSLTGDGQVFLCKSHLLTYTGWISLVTDSLIVRVTEEGKIQSFIAISCLAFFIVICFLSNYSGILLSGRKSAAEQKHCWVYIPAERKENGAAILFSHQFPSLLVGGVVVLENARSCWTLGLSTARIRHFAGFSDTKAAKMWFHTKLFRFSSLDLNVEFRTKV